MKTKFLKIILLSVGSIACPPKAQYMPGEDQGALQAGEAVKAPLVQTSLPEFDAETTPPRAQAACAGPSQSGINSLLKLNPDILPLILLSQGLISATTIIPKIELDIQDTYISITKENMEDVHSFFSLLKLAELSLVSKQWHNLIQPVLRACRAYVWYKRFIEENRPSAIAHFLWNNQNTFFISSILECLLSAQTAAQYNTNIQRIEALGLGSAHALTDFRTVCDTKTDIKAKLQLAIRLTDQDRKAAIVVYGVIVNHPNANEFDRLTAAKALVALRVKDQAIRIYQDIATDSKVKTRYRLEAAKALKALKAIDQAIRGYESIAMFIKGNLTNRFKAAQALGTLEATDKAIRAYESIAFSTTIDMDARLAAAKALEALTKTDKVIIAYESIATDPKAKIHHRFEIAKRLQALQITQKAIIIYESIATDSQADKLTRLKAVEALKLLGAIEKAKLREIYSDIGNAFLVGPLEKLEAAEGLASLGEYSQAGAIFRDIIKYYESGNIVLLAKASLAKLPKQTALAS